MMRNPHHTVNLLTSTIKIDAEQSGLRFCFRIISPTENYTLQAESALDQMDWIEKITGVIASLLSFQAPEKWLPAISMGSDHHKSASESGSFESTDVDHPVVEEYMRERRLVNVHHDLSSRSLQQQRSNVEKPIELLRRICGNNKCADCGAPGPDWASLNLGVLICIECSGVHHNLGVHISNVRSLTLDVKVWEELLQSRSAFQADLTSGSSGRSDMPQLQFTGKPNPAYSISAKEKFIHAKYGAKINPPDSRGWTPLHCCIIGGRAAFAKLLLSRGADPRVANAEGKTPLDLALQCNFVDGEVLSQLSDSSG